MGDKFCLRWKKHERNFVSTFEEMLENDELTNCTLQLQNGQATVKCHQLVLAASSAYFRDIFQDTQFSHPTVVLKDVRVSEMQAILEYVYRGEVNVNLDELAGFMEVADMLQIKGLMKSESRTPKDEVECSIMSPPDVSYAESSSSESVPPLQIDLEVEENEHKGPEHLNSPDYIREAVANNESINMLYQEYSEQSVNPSNKKKRISGKFKLPTKSPKYKNYSQEALRRAIDSVKVGEATALIASKVFGIPSRTLYDKLKREGVYSVQSRRRSKSNASNVSLNSSALESSVDVSQSNLVESSMDLSHSHLPEDSIDLSRNQTLDLSIKQEVTAIKLEEETHSVGSSSPSSNATVGSQSSGIQSAHSDYSM